jgi:hypothetical protein
MPGVLRRLMSKAVKRDDVQLSEKTAALKISGKPTTNGIAKSLRTNDSNTADDLIERIKVLASQSDAVECTKIQDRLREAQYALETPYETMLRLSAGVSTPIVLSLRNSRRIASRDRDSETWCRSGHFQNLGRKLDSIVNL